MDARLDIKRMLVAILIDVTPVNVFDDQVRLAGGRDACVNEVRDVGVGEAREKAPLAPEPLLARASAKPKIQELHRRTPFEATIAPSGHPDRAHSSLADG